MFKLSNMVIIRYIFIRSILKKGFINEKKKIVIIFVKNVFGFENEEKKL